MRKQMLSLSLLVLALFLGGCQTRLPVRTSQRAAPTRLTGFLEAGDIDVAFETGGRIAEILVDEGESVTSGQLLARLDDSLLALQLAAARADVVEAEAKLAQLQAAVRPVDVKLAEARVQYAEVALEAAEQALADAIALRDNPQQLDLEIAQAQAEWEEAKAHARAARHQAEAADLNAQMWGAIAQDLGKGIQVPLPGGGMTTVAAPADKVAYANQQWNLANQAAWRAWQDAYAAEANVELAAAKLKDLKNTRANPLEAEARVVEATNARDEAKAALVQAQAALDAVKAGPTSAQLRAAEAAVEQAQSRVEALRLRLEQTRLYAPADGAIATRFYAPGEVVAAGEPVFDLQPPHYLEITVYVPASMLDAIGLGQSYPIRVDTAPGREFEAVVLHINDEPEYTLRQAQNVAEREAMVYAVRLRIDNPDPALRPGMPADVILED
ncbi:MAG: HlyD family efflux transporter periplasmic adaptor subunit [Caldilineae bacterium]|nr:MAG: HlyD family efflux transporter periplasmic adaptor subunit [Caldilineae bacterium]